VWLYTVRLEDATLFLSKFEKSHIVDAIRCSQKRVDADYEKNRPTKQATRFITAKLIKDAGYHGQKQAYQVGVILLLRTETFKDTTKVVV
jgi:hypothetical protein